LAHALGAQEVADVLRVLMKRSDLFKVGTHGAPLMIGEGGTSFRPYLNKGADFGAEVAYVSTASPNSRDGGPLRGIPGA
jgi:hypothetical protein